VSSAGGFLDDFDGSALDADVYVPRLLPFRDPAMTDEFDTPRLAIDVADFHVYGADWRPGRVAFLVDGEHVKTVHQAPDYPMQMMVAVFDFPAKAEAGSADHVPLLAVDYVR
jgi:hypothetical protein